MDVFKKIRELIGLETDEEKLVRYDLLKIDFDKAEEALNKLADDFMFEKSLYEKRISDEANASIIDRLNDRWEIYVGIHKGKIQLAKTLYDELNKKVGRLEKSIKKSDPVHSDLHPEPSIESIRKSFQVVKKAYKIGALTSEGFDEAIRKTTKDKKIKYADFLLFNEDGEILLLKKNEWEDINMGIWVVPGGHVDPGEEFHIAAVRELSEESGFSVDEYKNVGSYETDDIHIEYFSGYVNRKEKAPVLQWEEIRDYRWVPLDELIDYDMVFNMKENIFKILQLPQPKKVTIRKGDKISKAMELHQKTLKYGDHEFSEKLKRDIEIMARQLN